MLPAALPFPPGKTKEALPRAGPLRDGGAMPGIRPGPYLGKSDAARDRRRSVFRSLHHFAVQRDVEALGLDLLRNTKPDGPVDQLEDDQGHDDIVDEHDGDALDLVDDLRGVPLDQARGLADLF